MYSLIEDSVRAGNEYLLVKKGTSYG